MMRDEPNTKYIYYLKVHTSNKSYNNRDTKF